MFAEDLNLFLPDFGVAATLDGAATHGIFDNGYALGNVGLTGMASTQPSIVLPTANVPGSPIGAAVTVNATAYLVAAHEPDGTGISRLMLEASA